MNPLPLSGDAGSPTRYDTPTILLHWLTALLVIGLFALAEIWDALPRGTPARKLLQSLHVLRPAVCGRAGGAHCLALDGGAASARASGGIWGLAGSSMHVLLYVLMAAQVVLGFLFRWAQGEAFTFSACSTCPR